MNDLKRVVQLANLMVQKRQQVEAIKTDLETATAELRRIETEDLPELMREFGMKSVTVDDGSTIELTEEVECSITEAKRSEAHKWLIENGFGGLIKTEVVVAFGRGEHDAAVACAASIGGTTVERVHPSTLKSFVKEQMAAGKPVPFETFSVFPYTKARLKKA